MGVAKHSRFLWAWILIANPISTCLFGGLLAYETRRVVGDVQSRSLQTQLPLGKRAPQGCCPFRLAAFVRKDSGLRMHDPNNESWGEVSSFFGSPSDLLFLEFQADRRWSGLLATTRESWAYSIFRDGGSAFQPSEVEEARNSFTAILVKEDYIPPDVRGPLSRGNVLVSHRLASGYVSNSLLILSGVLSMLSLVWVPTARSRVRRWRAAHLSRKGRCGVCGYSVAGLTASVCPECGTLIPNEKPPALAGGSVKY